MQLTKCPNGHYYDASLNASCPHCTGASANANRTVPLVGVNDGGQPSGRTESAGYNYSIGATVPLNAENANIGATVPVQAPAYGQDSEKTVALIMEKTGIDPVVGWLVCTEGAERGRDYRLHDGNNFIGRDAKMDVCIHGDDQISRQNHAWLAYDAKNKLFIFGSGTGRNIVYLNDTQVIGGQQQLKPYDKITIGNTSLLFVPFCGESYTWM